MHALLLGALLCLVYTQIPVPTPDGLSFLRLSFEQGVRRLACGSHVCRRLSPLSNLWVINMKNIRAVVLVVFAHVKREAVVRDVHEKCLRVQLITVLD